MTHVQQSPEVKDPVCGMEVDPATTKYTSEYHGQVYSFCSLMCLKAFEDSPQQYLTQAQMHQQ